MDPLVFYMVCSILTIVTETTKEPMIVLSFVKESQQWSLRLYVGSSILQESDLQINNTDDIVCKVEAIMLLSSQNSLENHFSEIKQMDNGSGILDQRNYMQRLAKVNTIGGESISVSKKSNCYEKKTCAQARELELQKNSTSQANQMPLKRKATPKKQQKVIKLAKMA